MTIPGVRKTAEFWTKLDLVVLKAVETALQRHEDKCFKRNIAPIKSAQTKLIIMCATSSGAVGLLIAIGAKLFFGGRP